MTSFRKPYSGYPLMFWLFCEINKICAIFDINQSFLTPLLSQQRMWRTEKEHWIHSPGIRTIWGNENVFWRIEVIRWMGLLYRSNCCGVLAFKFPNVINCIHLGSFLNVDCLNAHWVGWKNAGDFGRMANGNSIAACKCSIWLSYRCC